MQVVSVRVPAKVNIVLRVGPPRPDGFHDLVTVFHAVSLYDEITARSLGPPGDQVTVTADGPYAVATPVDDTNLAVRAVNALAAAAGIPAQAALTVHKRIPVAAGVAGGSADAAGALLACNELWGLGWSGARLAEVGATLGSDVPFALSGGTAIGTGRGEQLEPVSFRGELHWVLAVSAAELSTPHVYRRLDELRATASSSAATSRPAAGPERIAGRGVDARLLQALESADAPALGPLLANDLQDAAVDFRPALVDTLAAGRKAGALGGIVSGSGPTCLFLARDAAHAGEVAAALAASGTCATAEAVHGPAWPSFP